MKHTLQQHDKFPRRQFKRLRFIRYSLSLAIVFCLLAFADRSLAADSATVTSCATNLESSEVTKLLSTLLFIAWLVERFFETIIKAIAYDKKANLDTVAKAKKSSRTQQLTAIGGFLIGLLIYLAGVRTIGSFCTAIQPGYLGTIINLLDGILTASVIAGGSQGVHQLANAYQGVMQILAKLGKSKPDSARSSSTADREII